MKTDQYDYVLTTSSDKARDHYVDGLDRLLAGRGGISKAFEAAVSEDPGFALGYAGLARGRQFEGNFEGARAAINEANARTKGISSREASHVEAFSLLIGGKGAEAYTKIRAHVDEHPRDALVAQTCSSVFGLIGFSGRPGREAETLAYMAKLAPDYGEDWWCLSQYAFALSENGDQDRASEMIERSLALNPRNANGAHVRSHVYYESGEAELGISYLDDWLRDYERSGYLHGHLSWHCALWALNQGQLDTMWQKLRDDIKPGASDGLPINILTDTASLLYRAEMAGVAVPAENWAEISAYAQQAFPEPSIGFIDIHSALAHAMAGRDEPLNHILEHPNPSTGDLVTPLAGGFRAMAAQQWEKAVDLLTTAMSDHARLGGSRAQRDMLELALLHALLKLGRAEESQRLLALRRPVLMGSQVLHGLSVH